MAEKVTVMVLKVDLQCSCCYKKVKKILCKFPQIRDQVYDAKANTVTITVVCCNPENIRDKLCCKGAGVIKSIDIKEPPKPKVNVLEEAQKTPNQKQDLPEKTLEQKQDPPEKTPKQKEKQDPLEKTLEQKQDPPQKTSEQIHSHGCPTVFPPRTCCGPCSKGYSGGPCYDGSVVPPRTCCEQCSEGRSRGPCYDGYGVSPRTCCGPCSVGRSGGPCYNGYGVPPRTYCRPCLEGRLGGPCYDGYGVPPPPQACYDSYYGHGSRGCHASRCDYYLSDDNPQGCSIM